MIRQIRQHPYYWLLTRAAVIVLLIAGFFASLGLIGSVQPAHHSIPQCAMGTPPPCMAPPTVTPRAYRGAARS